MTKPTDDDPILADLLALWPRLPYETRQSLLWTAQARVTIEAAEQLRRDGR